MCAIVVGMVGGGLIGEADSWRLWPLLGGHGVVGVVVLWLLEGLFDFLN